MKRLLRNPDFYFVLLLLAYALYAALFVWRTSFVVGGERYFVLFDDAMISMRYASNLAQGYGLVWNPGEARVEGFTNPLWVGYMALFHLLPVSASKLSLPIQVSGWVFLLANLLFVRKIAARLTGNDWLALLAVFLTAFYLPLNNWGLLGMEVSLLALISSAAVWMGLETLRTGRFSIWLYLLLGASTLVRFDMVVIYLAIFGFLFIAQPQQRWKHLGWGLGLLAVFLLGQTAMRYIYYGEWLPNTYYLKVAGIPLKNRLTHGIFVAFLFFWYLNWILVLLPLAILLLRRDRQALFLAFVFLAQVAYSVYVGGDAWEHRGGANRYIAIVMPLFFILFIYAVELVRKRLVEKAGGTSQAAVRLSQAGMLGFILFAFINFNVLIDFRSLERLTFRRQPDFIQGNQEYVKIARNLRQITSPEANIAVVAAGAIPYFSERPAIDLLGKSDAYIAHTPPHGAKSMYDLEAFRPGHMKWDYDYSIGELKPDVIVQLWRGSEGAQPYLDWYYLQGGTGDGFNFWLRKDSPYINWEKVKTAD